MTILLSTILFITGCAIGSFLGVVVDRLLNGESIWKGRSHCDHCRHNLRWYDLLPIISFFAANRKCRYCQKKLSWFYPSIEIITGISFLLIGYKLFGNNLSLLGEVNYLMLFLYYLLLTCGFIVIFFADIKYGIIPLTTSLFMLAVIIGWYILLPFLSFSPIQAFVLGIETSIISGLLSALAVSLLFGFFYLRKWMGLGDVIYAFLMGLILGFPKIILGLYIAFITGAIIGVALVLLKMKKIKHETIPFGPFLVLGTFVSMLYGDYLINWILSFLIL